MSALFPPSTFPLVKMAVTDSSSPKSSEEFGRGTFSVLPHEMTFVGFFTFQSFRPRNGIGKSLAQTLSFT